MWPDAATARQCPHCSEGWNEAAARPVLSGELAPLRTKVAFDKRPIPADPYSYCPGCGTGWAEGDPSVWWHDTDNGHRFRFRISHELCLPGEAWAALQGAIDWAFLGPSEGA